MKKVLVTLAVLFLLAGCQAYRQEIVQPPGPLPPPREPAPMPAQAERVPSIAIMSAPTNVGVGEPARITWRIDGPATAIPHTAVHYGMQSRPGTFGTEVGPQVAGYPALTKEYASGSFAIPDTFTADIVAEQAGMLYFRAHAIVNGKQYWTGERMMSASEAGAQMQAPQPATVNAVIEDFSFKPATIRIKKGDTVFWTQKDSAPHTVTQISGLEGFESGTLMTGQTFSRTFTTPGTYEYKCSIHPYMRGTIIVE